MTTYIKNFALPIIFLIILLVTMTFGGLIPVNIKSVVYAYSLLVKEMIVFFMPVVIFSLVFIAINRIGKSKATKFIIILIPLVCSSNFVNTLLSYLFTMTSINFGVISNISLILTDSTSLEPAFNVRFISIISNDWSLLMGGVLGFVSCFWQNSKISIKMISVFELVNNCFFKSLTFMMPVFFAGTALKLQYDGILKTIFSQYLVIVLIFIVSSYGVLALSTLLLTGGNLRKFFSHLKNIIPAVLTGFGAMSSVAALPFSIQAAEKNLGDKSISGIVVPSTVNIHLVGDCFFIPMVAIAVMISFGMEVPSFSQYLLFSFYFVLAKFAVAAVPAGGVLVMIPIMQKHLGLNAEMLSLVTAIYILFDPIITACNVAGNSYFALLFNRVNKIFEKRH